MKEQSRQFKKTLSSLILVAIGWIIIGCTDERLSQAEMLMETDSKAADSILINMPIPTRQRDRAWYAVLKTQADYKQYKPITSDSLILTATDYYGTHRKSYRSAMAWYTQGCVYKELGNDFSAIDTYLRAKDLFPDTLSRYYSLTEIELGSLYLKHMMLDKAMHAFYCSLLNGERLDEPKIYNYSYNELGLCALYSRDFLLADSIFTRIFIDSNFSRSMRIASALSLAKIQLHYYNNYHKALEYVNYYLKTINDYSKTAAGLSVKADIFYEMQLLDSAYYYSKESLKHELELYTRCANADRLSELSPILDKDEESAKWHRIYKELNDSITKIESAREIEEIRYQHKEIVTGEKYAHRHKVIIIVLAGTLLMITLILFFIYSTFKHREVERIMKKKQELLKEEEEIRKSTIEMLESKIKDYSDHDPEARALLIRSYSNRLQMCNRAFRMTSEYNMLSSFKLNVNELNRHDKETLFNQLKRSYLETITDMQAEIPEIKEKDILTIILKNQGLGIEQIASLFSITTDSVKKRLYRLSQKVSSDFLAIYSI